MRVAFIGATGFVGTAVAKELLDRGHAVTAISRTARALGDKDPALYHPVSANATDPEELALALKGHDAVVSCFNAGWDNPNLYADFLAGSRAIQEAIKSSGVARLLVVGGAGSLFIDGNQLVDGPDFPQEYKAGATAARDYLSELRSEEKLDWTFLSPAIEMHPGTSGERKGSYRMGSESPVFDDAGRSVISVEDLAVAIVDELERHTHSRERFTVAY